MADDGIGVVLFEHITVAKTIAMLVLGLGSFILGMLPIKLTSRKWWRPNAEAPPQPAAGGHSHPGHSASESSPIVSLLLCFGGGVLLFTTFLHLQPEVRESVVRLQRAHRLPDGHGTENLGDLIFCVGFFLVFIIDQIVHAVLDGLYGGADGQEMLHRSMSLRRRDNPAAAAARPNEIGEEQYRSLSWEMTLPARQQGNAAQQRQQPRRGEVCNTVNRRPPKANGQSFRGLFAVLALSFHEVFEGLAIGLEERVDHMWYLFFAVATHKLIIAFCIGLELAWLETKKAVLVAYVATFAVVTPVGIAIGMMLVRYGNGGAVDGAPGLVAVVLQGLAAGTLLYVVFFEVLARYKQSGFSHLSSIILGFAVMLMLQMMTHHSHSHVLDDNHHQYLDLDHESHEHTSHTHGHEHGH
ncbi:zinc transporter ZIP2-like [Rhopalosiphum padi]|uniref:zinc transporter ZIP2-like n=1 Tax=Rhopalosiphum padi TaxID=40932 RepID=UPI00298E8788|nr:zinc transporter ZIP2-like [Rhopalosiphum padi]XP_060845046.1 zinc transporter ZIP2-like [Rhopalosiphum padi]